MNEQEPKLKTIINNSIRKHGLTNTKESLEIMKAGDVGFHLGKIPTEMIMDFGKKGLHYLKHCHKGQ